MRPDSSFAEQVKDVLAHLYDYPYLQNHPLTDELQPGRRLSARERMRFLRRALLEAIEEMNPVPDVPSRSGRARAYDVLRLHYVEGLVIQQVAQEVSVSKRQVYRDLRKAERALAALLLDRYGRRSSSGQGIASDSRADLVLQEAQRLGGEMEEIPLELLLRRAVDTVSQLAQKRTIRIECTLAPGLDSLYSNRQIARQVLVSTLSYAVQGAQPDTPLRLLAQPLGGGVRFEIEFRLGDRAKVSDLFPAVARRLISRLGGECSSRLRAPGSASLVFTLGKQPRATVLVIDDNRGLAELFRRYLADTDYQLIEASNGQEGLHLAEDGMAHIVVLDVMMPQQDGWEVLQWLQTKESTCHLPVIICSVFDDPELAYSLGATDFLAKPVSRPELLAALSQCQQGIPVGSHPGWPEDAGSPLSP